MTERPSSGSLRERKKAATRQAIQEHALRLFLAQGYERTTVAEIADAAGVSQMTFFRYFATKEEVVERDDYDPLLAVLIAARPAGESGLRAIGVALSGALAQLGDGELDTVRVRTRLILTTPALRARLRSNQEATQRLLADALAARADSATSDGATNDSATSDGATSEASAADARGVRDQPIESRTAYGDRVVAGAALSAIESALEAWVALEPPGPLVPLVEAAFEALLTDAKIEGARPPDSEQVSRRVRRSPPSGQG